MNPPLRAAEDVTALLGGIADGTIEILASDHAPHAKFEKEVEFDQAPFGIVGLETELGLFIDLLVHKTRTIELPHLIGMFTSNPARLLKLNAGTLSAGAPADVTLIDPALEWTVDAASFQTLSCNTPFDRWKLQGRAVQTIVDGETVWKL
jgi:dihydroorotase